jgi:REP element-mobilizing transposase RayT
MSTCWLLTSTTYGTWLPGDARGFVSTVTDVNGERVRHNQYGEPYDADMPRLEAAARQKMKGPAVYFSLEQAKTVIAQFRETAAHRGWLLFAVAVMSNHFHVVAGGGVNPEWMLRDLKSYASRALNRQWGKPASGTWWTTSGSKRRLPEEAAVAAAVRYVLRQERPLVVWSHDTKSRPVA